MKHGRGWRVGAVMAMVLFLFLGVLELDAWPRGGGVGGLGGGLGGGIGLLEILLFGAIAFGVVSYLRRRRPEALAGAHGGYYTMGSGGYAGGCGSSYADRTDTAVEEPP